MEVTIGARVRRERTRLGWDQAELARRIGVGQQTVSGWERGTSRPRRAIGRLAEVFGVDEAALLRDAGYVTATADSPQQVAAPVRPLLTILPILPIQDLTPEQFEDFTADLARQLFPDADVHRQGAQGHKQYGVDVVINHARGKPSGIQCKRERQFGPAKVRAAVSELTMSVRKCYIFLTRTATPDARREIRKHPGWELWDVADISRTLRQLPPESAIRLVDTYFPRWREPFLGVAEPGPWLTTSEFFLPFSGERILSHDWELVGRDDELAGLALFAADSEGEVGVLVGRGGTGKSRLLRAFAARAEADGQAVVRFLAPALSIRPEHFELLPQTNPLIVVVDDAHDRTDLGAVLGGVQRFRPGARVLLALRPYGQAQLASDLRTVGLHPSEVPSWRLDDLKTDAAVALARAALGPEASSAVVQQLAAVGADCPLLIVVAARLISRGKLDPARLEGSGHLRDEILEAFRKAMIADPASGDPEVRHSVLKAVAILQPFRAGDPDFQSAMAALTGKPYDQAVHHLRSLEDGGVLLRRGHSLRIVPDLLGDVILARAISDTSTGLPTGYLDRVHRAVTGEPLLHVFVNGSRVDWQVRQGKPDASSIVEPLWNAFEQQFRDASPGGRLAALKVLRKVAYFQPGRALALTRWASESPAQEAPTGEDSSLQRYLPTNDDVLRDLPPVIENVSYHTDYLPAALDLLWQLSQHDERPTNQHPEHPIRILCGLAEYQVGKPLRYNHAVIDAAQRWLNEPGVTDLPHSPFDVLEPLLATELEERTSNGYQLSLRSFSLNTDTVTAVRGRVVDLALSEAKAKDPRRSVRAIVALSTGLHYPRGMYNRTVGDADHDRWTPILRNEIERLGDIGSDSALDPLVTLAIRQALHWHADGSGTKDAAQRALQRLPASIEHGLTLALHDGWGRLIDRTTDFRQAEHNRQTYFDRVASAASARWTDNEVCDRLAERITLDRRAFKGGTAGHPGPFVWTLVRTRPSIGIAICRRIIQDQNAVLLEFVPVVLTRLAHSNPDDAIALAQEMLSTCSLPLARQVASAFGWARGDRSQLLDGEADLLRSLVTQKDTAVRRLAVQAARSLSRTNRPLALGLATTVRFADDVATAAEVLSMFGTHGHLRWEDLSTDQSQNLVDQLCECPFIDEYEIMDFLSHLSRTDPDSVIKLLFDRVEVSDGRPYSDYRPLPLTWDRTLQVRAHDRFPDLLRTVRDWIVEGIDIPRRRSNGPEIFRAVAQDFDAQAIQVLDEALQADTSQHIRTVGSIMHEAPRNLVWDNVPFVTRILHAAGRHGPDHVRAIGSALHAAVITGSRWGTPGEPFQEDIEQRDKSAEIARGLPSGSVEQRFYESLTASAEHSIRWEIDHDTPADRREW